MSHINIQITTPIGVIYTGQADEIIAPTVSGIITVLPNHIPLISILKSGELIVKTEKESTSFAVHGGVIEVRKSIEGISQVILLVDRSERADQIDLKKAENAYSRVKELADGLHADDVDFARFESLMDKELNRIRIAKKYK